MLRRRPRPRFGSLDIDQLDYKGLTADRDRLVGTLGAMEAAG